MRRALGLVVGLAVWFALGFLALHLSETLRGAFGEPSLVGSLGAYLFTLGVCLIVWRFSGHE
jgi:hypothetical protein